MKLSIVTPTGDRHEAFGLCERWMSRQTRQPDQWLVLDDGLAPIRCTLGQERIKCLELRGVGSLAGKLALAVQRATGDAIVIIEDDDWYAPTWLEWCEAKLAEADVIGEGHAVYYNVAGRWWYSHHNEEHASLCSTAISRAVFPILADMLRDESPWVDVRLWEAARLARRAKVFVPEGAHQVIGIKGMPGRAGYGCGHRRSANNPGHDDPSLAMLGGLLGSDATFYAPFHSSAMNQHAHEHGHGHNWRKWLGELAGQPDIAGMEIGTFRGESAAWMCANIFTHPSARYHCVDPFTLNVEHHLNGVDAGKIEKDARGRLDCFPQARIEKMRSGEFLRARHGAQFDFIYVDGAHDSMNVLRDAVLAWDLLLLGGVMVFDDYEWKVMPTEIERPKLAIDAFLQCYAHQLEVLAMGWQVAVRKVREG